MSLIWITIIAAVIAQVVGWLWHGPLFGKQWGMSCGMSEEQMKTMKPLWKQMAWPLGLNFIANLAYAFILFNLLGAFGAFTTYAAIHTSAIIFAGFILPLLVTNTIWNGRLPKSQKIMFGISFGYQIINLVIWSILFSLLA